MLVCFECLNITTKLQVRCFEIRDSWVIMLPWFVHIWCLEFTKTLRFATFLITTQRMVIIPCRRFGATCLTHLQGSVNPRRERSWPLKMEPISCPETSVRNYHYTLRYNPEERRSQLLRGGSLKSQTKTLFVYVWSFSHLRLFILMPLRQLACSPWFW
jgi:hypothetical protein